jgi:hypothetical protein
MTPAITLADDMGIPMPATRALSVLSLSVRSASTTLGRLRRRLTSVLLAVSLTVGTIAISATPAEAAGYVAGCFVSNKPGLRITGVVVQLQAYSGGTWVTFATTSLPPSQCVGWTIHPNSRGLYLRMSVNYQANGAYWFGVSPLMALPGDQAVSLDVGVVTCYGCAV